MSTKDKIDLCAQSYKLYFFKEGMFYGVYNQNAMWFQKNVNAYKISVKFVKIVNQKIYSLGFPQNVLHSNSFNFNLKKKETPNYVCYQNNNIVTEQGYSSWCAVQGVQLQKKESSQGIIKELQYFDLVNKTPMQALEFVAKLKTLL